MWVVVWECAVCGNREGEQPSTDGFRTCNDQQTRQCLRCFHVERVMARDSKPSAGLSQ